MSDNIHPLSAGDRVYHAGQRWARTLPEGTAEIIEVMGPYHDGAYEYKVRAAADFSRRPGPDNPDDRETQWASYQTCPAYNPYRGPFGDEIAHITMDVPDQPECRGGDDKRPCETAQGGGKCEHTGRVPEQYAREYWSWVETELSQD